VGSETPRTDFEIDEYLFRNGRRLEDYFLDREGSGELIGYRQADGRDFYLMISHDVLAAALIARLKALGVRVRQAES